MPFLPHCSPSAALSPPCGKFILRNQLVAYASVICDFTFWRCAALFFDVQNVEFVEFVEFVGNAVQRTKTRLKIWLFSWCLKKLFSNSLKHKEIKLRFFLFVSE